MKIPCIIVYIFTKFDSTFALFMMTWLINVSSIFTLGLKTCSKNVCTHVDTKLIAFLEFF